MLRGSLRRSASMIACSLLFFVSLARAQPPHPGGTPASTAPAPFFIPEKMPANAAAEGWSQEKWTEVREDYQQCLNIPAETTRREHLSPRQLQGLKPIPGDWEACKHRSSEFTDMMNASRSSPIPERSPQYWTAGGGTQGQWTGPAPAPSGGTLPTPIATPLPPALPVGP